LDFVDDKAYISRANAQQPNFGELAVAQLLWSCLFVGGTRAKVKGHQSNGFFG